MKVLPVFLVWIGVFLLAGCSAPTPTASGKKLLYYANPMDPTVHSDAPMKDSMGMDYVPVYDEPAPSAEAKAASGILYYASPMDPNIHSDKPMQDEMGMDYVPVYGEAKGITLTAAQEDLIGVQTAAVKTQILNREVTTLGKIAFNEKRTALVSARFAGRVERLAVNFTGAEVEAGQPLLEIYSPTLVNAQQELLQAARGRAGNTEAWSGNLLDSAKGKLRLWGLTEDQITGILKSEQATNRLPLLSPITGTVTRMNILAGQYVEEGAVLYEVANLDTVWMEAEVYEKDLAAVSLASSVAITPLAYPDQVFHEKVSFISPAIDPNTRTTRVRAEVDNPSHLLKPGMFVNVVLSTPGQTEVLALPESAVLDTGLRKLAYVKTGPGKYVGRTLVLQAKVGNFYPVISGVSAGEEVVVHANFLIDSESQLKGVVN